MPRAMWKGRVQFGPIDVPVKLYSAVGDIAVHSHLMHDQDNTRLEQRMVCSEDGQVVDADERVKGVEVTPGEFVVIEPEELDFLEPQASRQIQVTDFVAADHLDSRYLDRTYYLGPDSDDQLYINFMQSLQKSTLAGMCQWVMRKKTYIGVLKCGRGILTLTTHRFSDEVISPDAFKLDTVTISAKEKKIATSLVTELEEPFEPEQYHDEYQQKLQTLIDQKANGQAVELPALDKVPETPDKELLDTLEKSLKAIRKKS